MSHPSDKDFGKGWGFVRKEWERVHQKLNLADCALVFVAHAVEKKIKKKVKRAIIEMDRVQPDLPKTGLDLLHDLSDMILYYGHNDDGERKLFGVAREGLMSGCRGGIHIDNDEPSYRVIADAIQKATGKTYEDAKPTILLFGPPKIGKSTLAAQFPNPVVIDMENGYKFLDVEEKHLCPSWDHFQNICAGLFPEMVNASNSKKDEKSKEDNNG